MALRRPGSLREWMGLGCALLLLARSGAAQTSDPQRTAAAIALFQQAKALMHDKRYADACPKLEEVVNLEPTGLNAKLWLAECYEGQGRLASAWTGYTLAEIAARAANQPARAEQARDRAARLAPRLSHLTIDVAPALRGSEELTVKRDGNSIGAAQWGLALPVDGGRHTVSAGAKGKVAWERGVQIENEGESITVNVELRDEAPPPAKIEPPPPAPPKIEPPPPAPPAPTTRRIPTWAWISGAGGVALTFTGIALRLDVEAIHSGQLSRCGQTLDRCTYDPSAENARIAREGALFIGFTVAGGLAMGAAIVGILTAPSAPTARSKASIRSSSWTIGPWVAQGGGGALAGGIF